MFETQIKEARDRMQSAAYKIRDLKQEHGENAEEWSSEVQEQFNSIFEQELAPAKKELDDLETKKKRHEQADQGIQSVLEPQKVPPAKGPEPQQDQRKEAHMKAFDVYLRRAEQAARAFLTEQQQHKPDEIHTLVSSQDDLGGFLVPDDVRAEVIRHAANVGTMLDLVRSQTTSRDTLVFPKVKRGTNDWESSGFTSKFVAQSSTASTTPSTQDQPTFEQERIPVHRWQPDAAVLSTELLEDSAVNLEQLLQELIGDVYADDIDKTTIAGDGVNKPEGILTVLTSSEEVSTGSAAALAYAGFLDLIFGIPAQFRQNATVLMNSATMAKLLALEDTGSTLIFPPNAPIDMIFGQIPIRFLERLDDVSAGNKPIIAGDFSQYVLADRQQMRIQRLVEKFTPDVGFQPTARVGGQVIQTNAFRVQVVEA